VRARAAGRRGDDDGEASWPRTPSGRGRRPARSQGGGVKGEVRVGAAHAAPAGGSLGILIVALAPNIAMVLVGWCIAQLFFNAVLAAMVAVLPDQVPPVHRGVVAGILGFAYRSRR
jgi:MFS family permease